MTKHQHPHQLQGQVLPIEEVPEESLTLDEVQRRIDADLPCDSAEEYMLRVYLFDKKSPFNVDSKSKLEKQKQKEATPRGKAMKEEDWPPETVP